MPEARSVEITRGSVVITRKSRTYRHRVRMVAATASVVAFLVAGCSGDHGGRHLVSAHLASSTEPVTRVTGATPAALSVRVARALFTSTPVVVLARADERAQVTKAAAQARRMGVPLLLVEGLSPRQHTTSTDRSRSCMRTGCLPPARLWRML